MLFGSYLRAIFIFLRVSKLGIDFLCSGLLKQILVATGLDMCIVVEIGASSTQHSFW